MKLINLIKLRKQHGLLQQQVADALEITNVTYSKWETGMTPVPSNRLIQLANYFDTSVDYLLGRNKIIRITTYEKIDGEFKEVPTLSDKIKKG